ncbi:AAT family amino acid transporter [Xylona heveae TC161]|uniref:AAT family amino acid transporter n=1 Tax=Xylona heveae (strain CBS 132557 / TC161) TaxID=1328760 RepID=A0A165IJ75_XYLHT|nr:AAT family amino acid transporter [Xylona heveae TC161]KZF24971.1 AAT family amino acid transporter [Xylona heveae TC161]
MATPLKKSDPTKKDETVTEENNADSIDFANGEIIQSSDALQRHLSSRQIQLIAIGGSIGAALFVSIGYGLMQGAGSLLIAFSIYSCILALVNNSMAEMCIFMPVSASFVQHGSVWVDSAWGFMAGWNFFLFEALLVPFEITALDLILTFWRDDIPAAAVISACIFFYAITNVLAINYFGEAEFWLAGGKLLLIIILFLFTFITMVGGNPQRHAYGFRNWSKPSPFVEYLATGDLGRFEGFLAALWQACFTIVGPEYLATVAGEAQQPRKTLKKAFKSVYWRFGVFFIGVALCVGIVLPANDPTLSSVLSGGKGSGTGGASPFVIAMVNMKIEVLPHIVNALLCTSTYSAGNAYVYCATRSLYSLAQTGQAPKFLRKTSKNGIPIYCLAIVLGFACLAYLKLSSGSVKVLTMLTDLVTGGELVTYIVMCVNYLFFYRALKAQGFDRRELPYRGYFQPYGTWIAVIFLALVEIFYGYSVFFKGHWDIGTFFSYYTMVFLAICTFSCWKIIKRTRFVSPDKADLVWERPVIDRYEAMMLHDDVGMRRKFMQKLGLYSQRIRWSRSSQA